jgi:hypothetical protein
MSRRERFWRGPGMPLSLAAIVGLSWVGFSQTRSATASLDDRSEYLAVTASSGRGEEEVLWMFDTRSEELIVVAWDRQASMMMPLGRRDVSADVVSAARSR